MKNDSTLMEGRRKDTKELLPTRKLSKKTMEELKFEKYKLPRQAQTNLDTSNKPFYMNVNQEVIKFQSSEIFLQQYLEQC